MKKSNQSSYPLLKPVRQAFLLPALSLVTSLGLSAADSISVNMASDRRTVSDGSQSAGAIGILATNWNDASGANGTLESLVDGNGVVTTASITWSSNNTYFSGSSGSTATSDNGDLTRGYLDDGGAGWAVTVNSPYLLNNIYIYHATDGVGTMAAVSVNGTYYKGDEAGSTIVASGSTDKWSASSWTDADIMTESDNYLKISNQAAVVLAADRNSARAAIAGVQVENAYTGTLNYWDTNGATAGSGDAGGTWGTDTFWSASADGTVATGAWTSGNAAVFSAGADGTGTHTITLNGQQTADAVWVQQGDITLTGDGLTLSATGLLRGDSSLTVNSAITATDLSMVGTVVLGNAANSISGTVSIGGTSTITVDQTWGGLTGAGSLDIGANTLNVGNATDSNFGGTLTGTGSLVKTGTGRVGIEGDISSFAGDVTITDGTLALGSGTLNGSISGSGTFEKATTSNMVILSTNNTLTGKTIVGGGILRIADQTTLGVTPGSVVADQITLSGGGKIQGGTAASGVNMTLDANRGITITDGDSGFHTWTGFTTTVNGNITGAGNLGTSDGGTTIINGSINVDGRLLAAGGTLTLNGDASFGGTLQVQSNTTVNINSSTLNADGGISGLRGTTNINLGNGMGGTGTLEDIELGNAGSQSHTINHSAGDLTVTKDIRIGHWGGETSVYNMTGGTLSQADTVTNPVAEDQANLFLGIDGTGELHISGGTVNTTSMIMDGRTNTAGTDTLTLTGGTLNIGQHGIRAGNAGGTYKIELGGGTVGTTSSSTAAGYDWSASWSSSLNMELTGTNGNTTFATADKTITLSGDLSGAGGLVKNDTGTLTLSGANTYTGDTTVTTGTLKLDGAGSIASSSKLIVESGASLDVSTVTGGFVLASAQTLSGAGQVLGPIQMAAGSVIAPGNSPDTLTFNAALIMFDGSALDIELNGTDGTVGSGVNDLLTGITNLTLDGTLRLNSWGDDFSGAQDGDRWTVIKYSGALTDNEMILDDSSSSLNLGAGFKFELDTTTNPGAVDLVVTTIPEPSSAALLALGGLALVFRRRK